MHIRLTFAFLEERRRTRRRPNPLRVRITRELQNLDVWRRIGYS